MKTRLLWAFLFSIALLVLVVSMAQSGLRQAIDVRGNALERPHCSRCGHEKNPEPYKRGFRCWWCDGPPDCEAREPADE